MNKSWIFLFSFALAAVIAVIVLVALKPSAVNRENCVEVDAVVTSVTKGGLKDIVISLQGVRGIHFIEKGTEKGLSVKSLSEKLHGKKVALFYKKPGFLSGLSPVTDTRQIVELRTGSEVVYTLLH